MLHLPVLLLRKTFLALILPPAVLFASFTLPFVWSASDLKAAAPSCHVSHNTQSQHKLRTATAKNTQQKD